MFFRRVAALFLVAGMAWATSARSQTETPTPETVRVTVSMNADGSKTIYEFDAPRHRATATTTGKDGKLVGKIRYRLDDAGRFASGEVTVRTTNSALERSISTTTPANSLRKPSLGRTRWCGAKSSMPTTRTVNRPATPFTMPPGK